MAKKTLGYVELEWTCPNCSNKNLGTAKTCASCGSPQPTNVSFEHVEHAELVTDTEKVEAAKKGPDIHCPYCGTRNPVDAKICSQCSGDISSGERRVSGRVVGAYSTQPRQVNQIACPNCSTANPDTNKNCSACGANLSSVIAEAPLGQAVETRKGRPNFILIGAIALVGVIVVCLIIYLINASRRQDIVGTVQSINWTRRINVLELRDANYQGWKEDLPIEATVGLCEKREHHTQDQPAPDSVEMCGTPYTKDTGSGFGEVVQDCEYVVYLDYCDYTIMELQVVETVEASGDDTDPFWPTLVLEDGQRQEEQPEKYTIIFSSNDGTYTYTISDLSEFAQFIPGSEWILVINGFGQIINLEPK